MHLVRRHRFLRYAAVIVIGSSTMSACAPDATGPEARKIPSSPRMSLDCQLTVSECDRLRGGIDHLINHHDMGCQQRGNVALMRYESTDYGFRRGTVAPQYRMYVMMEDDASTVSGSGPTDNNTYVNAGAFTDEFGEREAWKIGSDIAHEEVHQAGQDNPDHNMGTAVQVGSTCV